MAMRFAQDIAGMDGSMSSPSSPASPMSPVQNNARGKSPMGRGGQAMLPQLQNYLNQSPYGGQAEQSQPMFTGAPSGGGGALGQLAANIPQTGIQPMQSQPMMTGAPTGGGGALGQLSNMQAQTPPNPQRMAQMLRGAGRMFGRF